MIKWLRRHTKEVMAAVVLFSMVSFVGGSALYDLLRTNPASEPMMKAFGEEFTRGDLQLAGNTTYLLEILFPVPQFMQEAYGRIWQFGRPDLTIRHWLLLREEARRAGIVVSEAEIEEELQKRGLTADNLETLRKRQPQFTPAEVRRCIGEFLTIDKNIRRIAGAAAPSEPEVRRFVRDTEEKVHILLTQFDANRFLDPDEPVTEEEVAAQFEANRSLFPEESPTGFGYRYPRRVKIQYVSADLDAIAETLSADFNEISEFWQANRQNYTTTEYISPPPPVAANTEEGAEPQKIPVKRPMKFSEAKAAAERDLKNQKALKVAQRALRRVISELSAPWLAVTVDGETGFKPVPPGGDDPEAMRAVSEKVAAEFAIPLKYEQTDWLTKEEIDVHPDLSRPIMLGEASTRLEPSDLAFRIPPFIGDLDAPSFAVRLQFFQPTDVPLITQIMELGGSNRQRVTQLLTFRVIEAVESQPAEDLSAMRERVERDVRLWKTYQGLESIAREFTAVARRIGVASALELYPDLQEKGVRLGQLLVPFARKARSRQSYLGGEGDPLAKYLETPTIPIVGQSESFIDDCFDMARDDWTPPTLPWPDTEPAQLATTRPAAESLPKMRLISGPKVHKYFLVQLTKHVPVDSEAYQSRFREQATTLIRNLRGSALRNEWLKPDAIEKRCAFGDIQPATQPETSEGMKGEGESEPAS